MSACVCGGLLKCVIAGGADGFECRSCNVTYLSEQTLHDWNSMCGVCGSILKRVSINSGSGYICPKCHKIYAPMSVYLGVIIASNVTGGECYDKLSLRKAVFKT